MQFDVSICCYIFVLRGTVLASTTCSSRSICVAISYRILRRDFTIGGMFTRLHTSATSNRHRSTMLCWVDDILIHLWLGHSGLFGMYIRLSDSTKEITVAEMKSHEWVRPVLKLVDLCENDIGLWWQPRRDTRYCLWAGRLWSYLIRGSNRCHMATLVPFSGGTVYLDSLVNVHLFRI